MFAFLRALGLEPVEWDQAIASAGEGSPFVGDVIESLIPRQAIVVMLTGDDSVQLHPALASPEDKQEEVTPQLQPRPNVIFEAGMALGNAQTKSRTILVQMGKVKLFSNIDGRHVVNMDNSKEARNTLSNRLKTAGCAVNTVGTDWLNVGDFEGCSVGGILQLARPEDSVPDGRALEILQAVGDATAGGDEGIGAGGVAARLQAPAVRIEHEMERLVSAGYLGSRTFWQKPRTFTSLLRQGNFWPLDRRSAGWRCSPLASRPRYPRSSDGRSSAGCGRAASRGHGGLSATGSISDGSAAGRGPGGGVSPALPSGCSTPRSSHQPSRRRLLTLALIWHCANCPAVYSGVHSVL